MTNINSNNMFKELLEQQLAQIQTSVQESQTKQDEIIYTGFAIDREEQRKSALEGELSIWLSKLATGQTVDNISSTNQIQAASSMQQKVGPNVENIQYEKFAVQILVSLLKSQMNFLKANTGNAQLDLLMNIGYVISELFKGQKEGGSPFGGDTKSETGDPQLDLLINVGNIVYNAATSEGPEKELLLEEALKVKTGNAQTDRLLNIIGLLNDVSKSNGGEKEKALLLEEVLKIKTGDPKVDLMIEIVKMNEGYKTDEEQKAFLEEVLKIKTGNSQVDKMLEITNILNKASEIKDEDKQKEFFIEEALKLKTGDPQTDRLLNVAKLINEASKIKDEDKQKEFFIEEALKLKTGDPQIDYMLEIVKLNEFPDNQDQEGLLFNNPNSQKENNIFNQNSNADTQVNSEQNKQKLLLEILKLIEQKLEKNNNK